MRRFLLALLCEVARYAARAAALARNGLALQALLLPAAVAAEERRLVHSVPPGVCEDDPDRARFRLDPARDPLRSFEDDSERWLIETWKGEPGLGEPVGEGAELSSQEASHGERSVALPFRFPRSTVIFKRPSSIGDYRYITYDVFVPAGTRGRVRSLFFVKNKDGLWFQAISGRPLLSEPGVQSGTGGAGRKRPGGGYARGRSASRLEPGRWNTVTVDLRGGGSDLVPEGNLARWQERFAQDAEVLGFAVFGEEPQEGTAYLDNLRGWKVADEAPPPLAVRNLTFPSEGVLTFEKWEATFELTREFENSFDPDVVSVEAVITRPVGLRRAQSSRAEGGAGGGEEVRVPGFFYQDFARRLTPAGEELVPAGPGLWKIRYGPREPGPHAFRIEVGAGSDTLLTRERTFIVTKGDHPGFVRVSERDPRAFEFTGGEPFYPIGHNVRSPTDNRCSQVLGWDLNPDEGTFTYDGFLERMAAGGETFVEVWMASWWVALEWTRDWNFYHGLGRYNLANAWKLDHVLAKARTLGLRVNLVIDNHGKYSTWCDKEWEHSPYNSVNRSSGGFLARPEEFFTDEDARRYYRAKARYIFARWGWDPTVMGFELVSELDLTGSRHGFGGRRKGQDGPEAPLRTVHRWHKEMIEYFRTIDQGRHIYTTHYSGNHSTIDPVMARLPEIDYVTGDGYRGGDRPFVELARASGALSRFKKPYIITEYGGNWNGTSEAALEADLHSGLWGGYMTPAGGTPLLWWFDFIDRRDLYWHFKALREFDRGEDRRDPELKSVVPKIESLGTFDAPLCAVAYMSRTRGYAWVYAEGPMMRYPAEPVIVEGARVRFHEVENGPWAVELWDTVKGEPVRSEILEAKDGLLEVELPRFGNDIAVKLRRTERLDLKGSASGPVTDIALEVGRPVHPTGPAKFISEWAVLGPFGYPRERLAGSLEERFVSPESRLLPRRGQSVSGKEWRFVKADGSGHVDLERLVGPADFAAAYAVVELWCEEEMRDVQLLVGSDDYLRVWLNGKRVISSMVKRAARPDQDRAEVRLRKGSNLLVLKVVEEVGGWGFYCRLAGRDGRAVPVVGVAGK